MNNTNYYPTVRPPRLGGNKRMGVFATRSPNRPNPIGLSAVKIDKIEIEGKLGPIIHLLGADLMDGTPIYDIKPYLPFADCIPQATGGFASEAPRRVLDVKFDNGIERGFPNELIFVIEDILSHDPRPRYQHDPERVYGMEFSGYEIKFKIKENLLTVISIDLKES